MRRVGIPTKESDMHLEDTPNGGNLTPIPAPSRSLLYGPSSNHASVTSELDPLGGNSLNLNSGTTQRKKFVPPKLSL
jgi:hypothetical protein